MNGNECVTYDAVYWYFFIRCLIPFVGLSCLALWWLYDRGKELARQRQEHYEQFLQKRKESEAHFNQVKQELQKRKRER